MYNKCINNTFYKKKNHENDVSYLALKSTRTIDTITRLNISKTPRNKNILFKMKTIIVVITTRIKSWVWWWLWMNAVQMLDTC